MYLFIILFIIRGCRIIIRRLNNPVIKPDHLTLASKAVNILGHIIGAGREPLAQGCLQVACVDIEVERYLRTTSPPEFPASLLSVCVMLCISMRIIVTLPLSQVQQRNCLCDGYLQSLP